MQRPRMTSSETDLEVQANESLPDWGPQSAGVPPVGFRNRDYRGGKRRLTPGPGADAGTLAGVLAVPQPAQVPTRPR